jgi:hypothetical protein
MRPINEEALMSFRHEQVEALKCHHDGSGDWFKRKDFTSVCFTLPPSLRTLPDQPLFFLTVQENANRIRFD